MSNGDLRTGEPHPASHSAYRYVQALLPAEKLELAEAFSSLAIEGNRLAEICSETLRRLMIGEPVSDRYILGLAWAIQDIRSEAGQSTR